MDSPLNMSTPLNIWELTSHLTMDGGNAYKEGWTQDARDIINVKVTANTPTPKTGRSKTHCLMHMWFKQCYME